MNEEEEGIIDLFFFKAKVINVIDAFLRIHYYPKNSFPIKYHLSTSIFNIKNKHESTTVF